MTFGDMVMNRGVNRVTVALLRSPVHRLVSGSTLLLSLTGRRSGRALQIPVSYKTDGDGLLITSLRRRLWWRNLRGGAAVRVLLAGEERTGHATVLDTIARKGTVLIRIELDPPSP